MTTASCDDAKPSPPSKPTSRDEKCGADVNGSGGADESGGVTQSVALLWGGGTEVPSRRRRAAAAALLCALVMPSRHASPTIILPRDHGVLSLCSIDRWVAGCVPPAYNLRHRSPGLIPRTRADDDGHPPLPSPQARTVPPRYTHTAGVGFPRPSDLRNTGKPPNKRTAMVVVLGVLPKQRGL